MDINDYKISYAESKDMLAGYQLLIANPNSAAMSEYITFPKGVLSAIEEQYASDYPEATHILVKFGVRLEGIPDKEQNPQLTVYFAPGQFPNSNGEMEDLGDADHQQYNKGHSHPPYVD